MLLAAILMIRQSAYPLKIELEQDQDFQPTSTRRYVWFWIAIEGIGVGILTGLVGVGGGFAIVPALVLLGNIPIKEAVGTSLLIIALKSVTGFLGYVGQVELDWQLIASFTTAASFGTILGVYLVPFVKSQQLQNGFSYFLVFVAGFIVWQNWVG
jgi:hypothetical protein